MTPIEKQTSSNPSSINPKASDARLAIWIKKLPQNPLPINLTTANHISRLLLDEDCDTTKLATLIRQDPILCLKLFGSTENVLKARDGEIQHIAHLIGLIGLNNIEKIINNSRKYHNQRLPEGFHEILSSSFLAAHLSTLILKRYEGNIDRFFLPTLFFNVPLWFMWIAAPKTMSHNQLLASRKQQPYVALSAKKLGFKLPDLLAQAESFVYLPVITHKALAINPSKDRHFWAKVHRLSNTKLTQWFKQNKQARQYFYSIEMGIYLVNQYAIAIYLDWNGKHIQRYQELLARYLHIEMDELSDLVSQITENIKSPVQYNSEFSALYRLRGLHLEVEAEVEEPTKKPKDEHKKEINRSTHKQPKQTSSPAHSYDTDHKLRTWCKKINASQNAKIAIDTTLKALTHGVGVEHCLILEMDDDNIHTEASYGFGQQSNINQFRYDWRKNNNIFRQLSKKPACLQLSKNDIPNASRTFPAEFISSCNIKPCTLLSIFDHEKPKAIIYCDHQDWDNEKHLSLKVIGKQLHKTLQHLH